MVKETNKHQRDVQFVVGETIYLKYRPYRQSSLFKPEVQKSAPRFYGPYKIVERIGATAYRLHFPKGSMVHPVFHISLLKKGIGESVVESSLPDDMITADLPFMPESIVSRRRIENGWSIGATSFNTLEWVTIGGSDVDG